MIDELVKSFKASMYERMTSPFLSSLFIFFIYFNWKAITVVLFSDDPVYERIQLVEAEYTSIYRNICLPASFALGISILYPFLSLIFVAVQSYSVVLKRTMRNLIEKNSTVSVKKYLELKENIYASEMKFDDLLGAKDNEIAELNKRISNSEKEKLEFVGKIDDIEQMLGKQNAVYGEKYDEFVKACKLVIANVQRHLNTDTNSSIASFWNIYGNKFMDASNRFMDKVRDHSGDFRLISVWVNAVSMRVDSGNLQMFVPELTDLFRALVSASESLRYDVKKILESDMYRSNKSSIGDEDTIKEAWNHAREDMNGVISDWKALLRECIDDNKLSHPYIENVRSIGEPINTSGDKSNALGQTEPPPV